MSVTQLKTLEVRYGRLQEPAWTFSTGCVIKDQSDVSFMHIHCVSHSVHSHLQHNIIECMRGVYVLIKHSSYSVKTIIVGLSLKLKSRPSSLYSYKKCQAEGKIQSKELGCYNLTLSRILCGEDC